MMINKLGVAADYLCEGGFEDVATLLRVFARSNIQMTKDQGYEPVFYHDEEPQLVQRQSVIDLEITAVITDSEAANIGNVYYDRR